MSGKIARGVSYVFISQILRMVAKGGLLLILTRYLLNPAEYGLLSLTLSVLGISMLFANLGLTKAGARYINNYREKSPDFVPAVIRSTLVYNTLLIIAVCFVLYFFSGQIANLSGEPDIAVLLVFGAGFIVTKSFQGNVRYCFHGFNKMGAMAVTSIISNVLLLITVPVLILLGFGLKGAISGYVLSYGVAAVLGMAFIYKRLYTGHSVTEPVRKKISRRILRYSAPLTLTMGANTINGHADRILLSVFRGPTAIAFYTLGKQISGFLVTPAASLGMGTSPTFGEKKANNELVRAAHLYQHSFKYTVAIYAPAAAGVVLVANPTLSLIFGSEYASAAPVLQIFSVYVFARALDAITNDALDYLGRARARAIAKGSLTIGNIVLNLLLIPRYGIVGAAVATVSTYCIYVALEMVIIADELPIDVVRLLRSAAVIGVITAGMSMIVYPTVGYISGVPTLVGVISLGGTVWLILTTLSGVVDPRQIYKMLS